MKHHADHADPCRPAEAPPTATPASQIMWMAKRVYHLPGDIMAARGEKVLSSDLHPIKHLNEGHRQGCAAHVPVPEHTFSGLVVSKPRGCKRWPRQY